PELAQCVLPILSCVLGPGFGENSDAIRPSFRLSVGDALHASQCGGEDDARQDALMLLSRARRSVTHSVRSGRRSAHGLAASSCDARRNSVASSPNGATNW